MNDNHVRKSKLTLRSDRAVGIASTRHGAALDIVGFNIVFITERSPTLAVEILRLWRQASRLKPDDPKLMTRTTLSPRISWTR
jgi:hypothetical protein